MSSKTELSIITFLCIAFALPMLAQAQSTQWGQRVTSSDATTRSTHWNQRVVSPDEESNQSLVRVIRSLQHRVAALESELAAARSSMDEMRSVMGLLEMQNWNSNPSRQHLRIGEDGSGKTTVFFEGVNVHIRSD